MYRVRTYGASSIYRYKVQGTCTGQFQQCRETWSILYTCMVDTSEASQTMSKTFASPNPSQFTNTTFGGFNPKQTWTCIGIVLPGPVQQLMKVMFSNINPLNTIYNIHAWIDTKINSLISYWSCYNVTLIFQLLFNYKKIWLQAYEWPHTFFKLITTYTCFLMSLQLVSTRWLTMMTNIIFTISVI